jgi:C-methyltransferase.
MVAHLKNKVKTILKNHTLKKDDFVLDIGSNDATTLKYYPCETRRIGFDPIGEKFKENYNNIELINDYFSYELCKINKIKNVKIINSFAMFYDLEDPNKFCRDISKIIDKEKGILILEQCYLPLMLKNNCYDTICHEHLAYYSLTQINFLAERNNLKVVDFEKNNINGGSFSVVIAHKSSNLKIDKSVKLTLKKEMKFTELTEFKKFSKNVATQKKKLIKLINDLKFKKKKIFAIGASTKGNVILQYCNLNSKDVKSIGEVNKNKFNKITPSAWIEIIDEEEV